MLSEFASGFDAVYCVHYLPYGERRAAAEETFHRHGLMGPNFRWFYTVPNKYFDDLYAYMLDRRMIFAREERESDGEEGYIKNARVFNLAVNEYNLMSQIWHLGYERVLVLEDDLAFMKDKDLLKAYAADYPWDYDIVSMEYWFRRDRDYGWATSRNRKVNDHFFFLAHERLVDFACVGLSRKGVRHWLDGMEQKFMNSDYYIANQGTFDDWRLRRCVSKVPMCVQAPSADSNHSSSAAAMKWKYDKIGLDLSAYEGY